jgi:hypothetical protein
MAEALPKFVRLRADLRHNSRAQSLVGDLLQQVLVAPGGEAPARVEQRLELVRQERRGRPQQVEPAAALSRKERQIAIDEDVGADPRADGRADRREQRAGSAVANEDQRAGLLGDLGRSRLRVQTPVRLTGLLRQRGNRGREATGAQLVGY